ncbi:MAG TPA: sigma-70 family RNA polymerase sigma factor [Bryobacteraceae bacterium]|nr:sigma-70 family RNA polymerase sigma factor [Bryobacteraceae bacterium]
MNGETSHQVTQLLLDWRGGHREALDALTPLVYDELRRMARRHLQRERPGHTLQSTALVNEAFVKMINQEVSWQNRAHFFAMAAQFMRRILVDHARGRHAAKRGGEAACRLTLDEGVALTSQREVDVMALDSALERLAALDPQQGRIVELRFFGGLSIEETAEVLEISPATVKREWAMARAWLFRELGS